MATEPDKPTQPSYIRNTKLLNSYKYRQNLSRLNDRKDIVEFKLQRKIEQPEFHMMKYAVPESNYHSAQQPTIRADSKAKSPMMLRDNAYIHGAVESRKRSRQLQERSPMN